MKELPGSLSWHCICCHTGRGCARVVGYGGFGKQGNGWRGGRWPTSFVGVVGEAEAVGAVRKDGESAGGAVRAGADVRVGGNA